MNLDRIKAIVNAGGENWKTKLLEEIAQDKDAIPYLLRILNAERHDNQELITDLNFQLSRAHVILDSPELNKGAFVQEEIRKFYAEGRVNHCYANMDKPKKK